MKYSKRCLGKEMKLELEKGYDITRISQWAYHIFSNYLSELNETELNILEELFRMDDDPQFELSEKEIQKIADKLIFEGEKEELEQAISLITEIATNLGENWLMCPFCQEVWEPKLKYAMVECPKCKNKMHNPLF